VESPISQILTFFWDNKKDIKIIAGRTSEIFKNIFFTLIHVLNKKVVKNKSSYSLIYYKELKKSLSDKSW